MVERALQNGTLVKPESCSCQGCAIHPDTPCLNSHRIEAHHPDHNFGLEVVWLCNPCHKVIDGRTKMDAAALASVRRLRAQGLSFDYISRKLGISVRTMREVVK